MWAANARISSWSRNSKLLFKNRKDPRMIVYRPFDPRRNMLHNADPKQTRLQLWLRIDSLQKPKVYAQIFDTAEIYNLNYWLEIVLSAGIAALGLVLNSPAVIIGAMLISP